MRVKVLEFLAGQPVRRTWSTLAVLLGISAVAVALASNLKLSMQISNLLPEEMPMVAEFNRIVEEFSTASNIIIVAEGEEEALRNFADSIEPRLEKFKEPIDLARCSPGMRKGLVKDDGSPDPDPWFRMVHTKLDTDFLGEHALLLMKPSALRNMSGIFTEPTLNSFLTNLNDSFEKEYLETDTGETTKTRENETVWFLDSVDAWVDYFETAIDHGENVDSLAGAAVDAIVSGESLYFSPDKDLLLLFAQPTFDVLDMSRLVAVIDSVEAVVHEEAASAGVAAGLTGTMALARDEMVAAMSDMMLSTICSLLVIFVILVFSFRMLTAPFLAIVTISVGVLWASALSYLAVGTLNMMTSMMAVILVGLGIDFSIHIISAYTEKRELGLDVPTAMREGLLSSGAGIITGGFTTSCAFLTLMISRSAGMYELGLVLGLGMLATMASTVTVLPLLLVLREKMRPRNKRRRASGRDITFRKLGRLGTGIASRWRFSLVALVCATLLFGWAASGVTFDYNYLNMEPEGLESIILQEHLIDELDMSSDYSLVVADGVEEARELAEKAKKMSTTGMTESISDFIPAPGEIEEKRALIAGIRERISNSDKPSPFDAEDAARLSVEIERLEMNIIELADLAFLGGQDKVDRKASLVLGASAQETPSGEGGGKGGGEAAEEVGDTISGSRFARIAEKISAGGPVVPARLDSFNRAYAARFTEMVERMTTAEPPTLADLPVDIVDRFANDDRSGFLVTIYPDGNVWDMKYLERLTAELKSLDTRVTGMPPLFHTIIKVIKRDGIVATLLAVAVIFVLLLLDFRSLGMTCMAMLPLLAGALWMVGLMAIFGIQFTIVNVMVIPMILGIGIDDGVHLLHRYRREGAGSIDLVMRSTGKAILLTSATTMLAFGSLKFATYRGLGSAGIALFVGVGACFLTSIFLVPAVIGLFESAGGRKE